MHYFIWHAFKTGHRDIWKVVCIHGWNYTVLSFNVKPEVYYKAVLGDFLGHTFAGFIRLVIVNVQYITVHYITLQYITVSHKTKGQKVSPLYSTVSTP